MPREIKSVKKLWKIYQYFDLFDFATDHYCFDQILYAWLFSPLVIFAPLHLLTVSPVLNFVRSQFCQKRDNWGIWIRPVLNLPTDNGAKIKWKWKFPMYSNKKIVIHGTNFFSCVCKWIILEMFKLLVCIW